MPHNMKIHQDANEILLNSLGLSNRTINALKLAQIDTLDQLLDLDIDTIKDFSGVGDNALAEIIDLRRQASVGFQKSYDTSQKLIFIKSQIPEWSEMPNDELLGLDVDDILPIYMANPERILKVAQEVERNMPQYSISFPLINILCSLERVKACDSVSDLSDYIFRDFSDIEKEILLKNPDGQRRSFAAIGRNKGLSRERIRQIYINAHIKTNSPYQRQRQSGLLIETMAAKLNYDPKDIFGKGESFIDILKMHYRGRSKKLLQNIAALICTNNSPMG